MSRYIEYAFVLPDGSVRYEIVEDRSDMFVFMKMHKAVDALPLERFRDENK